MSTARVTTSDASLVTAATPGGPTPSAVADSGTHPLVLAATPDVEERTDTDEVVGEDLPWDVTVWDDPVNLMAYVVHVFRKVLGVDETIARKLMLEVHNEGRSLVASEPRETAERYVHELHAHGLHATMKRGV